MNFPDFPLYTSLKKYSKETADLTDAQKDEVIELLKKYNDKHDVVYALIRAYYLEHEKNPLLFEISKEETYLHYAAKKLRSGFKYEIDCLPSGLQHMILHFLQIIN